MDRRPDPPLRRRVAARGNPPPPADPAMATVEDLALARARAAEGRAWVRALTPLVSALLSESDGPRDDTARRAIDSTIVAVLARLRRIARSDVGPGD